MTRTFAKTTALILALGFSTLLQGCLPAIGAAALGIGAAGTYGIVQGTQTVQQVGNSATNLIDNASEQLTLTAEAVRTTLGNIDVLVQHLTADADALTTEVTGDLRQLTDELSRQLQGLGELREQVQAAIAQGSQDLHATLANIDMLIQTTQASFDAVSRILQLVAATAAPKSNTARAIATDDGELGEACAAYLATRNLKSDAPAAAASAPAATEMPAFEDAATSDRS